MRRSKNFGRIFALLSLKANSEERGLDQQEISSYLNKNLRNKDKPTTKKKSVVSLSTISRTLNKMEQAKYCNSSPSSGRRKYYTSVSFKQLTLDRMKYNIQETVEAVNELHKLQDRIFVDESKDNTVLLEVLDNLVVVYGALVENYQDLLDKFEEKFKDL